MTGDALRGLAQSAYAVLVKRFVELTPSELAQWRDLMTAHAVNQRAFYSPSYCEAVDKVRPGVRIALLYGEAQVLQGVLALQAHRSFPGLLGVCEPIGDVMTDYFGLVARPGLHIDMADVLTRMKVGGVSFTHLDDSQGAYGLRGEGPRVGLRTVIQGHGPAHWDQLRTVDKKLVSDTERRERKLVAEHGALEFELQARDAEGDFAQLLALKKAQYDRTGKEDAPLFDPSNERLLRQLLASRDPDCEGVLSTLRAGGKLVAVHFGLRCRNVLHFWFPAYEKAFAAYSPGRILYRHVIDAGSRVGISVLDRGEGDTAAKRDFANEEHVFFKGAWFCPGWRGTLARGALAAYWRTRGGA